MAFKSNDNNPLMGDINITPLVDVMLVLLVIFMVTAPLTQQQVDVNLPQTQSKQSAMVEENDVILMIDSKKNISIKNTRLDSQTLTEKLSAMYKNKPKKEIFLQADEKLSYGFVVGIMAKIKNAGIDKIGMLTSQEKLLEKPAQKK